MKEEEKKIEGEMLSCIAYRIPKKTDKTPPEKQKKKPEGKEERKTPISEPDPTIALNKNKQEVADVLAKLGESGEKPNDPIASTSDLAEDDDWLASAVNKIDELDSTFCKTRCLDVICAEF